MSQAVTAVSYLFMFTVATSCSRAPWGPLTFVSTLWSDKEKNDTKEIDTPAYYTNRAHIDGQKSCGSIPMVGNGDARWYFRFNPYPNDRDFHAALAKLEDLVSRMMWLRKESFKAQPTEARERMRDNSPISVDIYLPLYMTTHGNLEAIQKWLGGFVKAELKHLGIPPHRSKNDSWRVKSIIDAPPCESCGWSTDLLT